MGEVPQMVECPIWLAVLGSLRSWQFCHRGQCAWWSRRKGLPDPEGLIEIVSLAVGDLLDVDQAVQRDADVNEGAQPRDVGGDSFEDHVWLKVGEFSDAFVEGGSDEPGHMCPGRACSLFEVFSEGEAAGEELRLVDAVEVSGGDDSVCGAPSKSAMGSTRA
jgi:hypothetical protein